jgi:hypothetical protein
MMELDAVDQRLDERRRTYVSGARQGQRGQKLAAKPGRGKTQIALGVAHDLDAIYVPVSSAVEQVTDAILWVSRALRSDEAPAALRASNDDIPGALRALSKALGETILVVDDFDRLGEVAPHDNWGIGTLTRTNAETLREWLTHHAGLLITRSAADDDDPLNRTNLTRRSLAHAAEFLEGRSVDVAAEGTRSLFDRVYEACPDDARRALALVALHGGPLDEAIIDRLSSASGRKTLVASKLLREWNGQFLAQPVWREWLIGAHPETGQELHPLLAVELEARVADGHEHTAAYALQAFRHYVEAGQLDRAALLARHSVLPLLDAARSLSVRKEYAQAARIYGLVTSRDPDVVGRRAASYARHYLHYNRAKCSAEQIRTTELGYIEALSLWPQNALFWSRRALTRFHQGDVAGGEAVLTEARLPTNVPEHPEKETILRSRTVARLVARESLYQALRVWADYVPKNGKDREAETKLLEACGRGWLTHDLQVVGPPAVRIIFRRPVRVALVRRRADYECSALEVTAYGPTPIAAFEHMAMRLHEEITRLIRALAQELSAAERFRKGALLAIVDPIASRLLAGVSPHAWVYGYLVEEAGAQWLEVGPDVRYEVPGELRVPADRRPRFALVRAGDTGEPAGPVQRLEEAPSDEPGDVLAEWAKRVAGDRR